LLSYINNRINQLICYRFCGIKTETDHIIPKVESNDKDIGNAMPLYFDCHAKAHFYNDNHPRGRKYTPEELKLHKERWIGFCEKITSPCGINAKP
jgi:hypothetical protein